MAPLGAHGGARVSAQRVPLRSATDDVSVSCDASQADNTSINHPQRTTMLQPVWQFLKKWKTIVISLLSVVASLIVGYSIGRHTNHFGTPSIEASDGRIGQPPSECIARLPADWIVYNKTRYYYSVEKLDWLSSKKFCEKHGAQLAVLQDVSILNNVKRFKNYGDDHWFGFYRMDDEWKWLNESSLEDERLNSISGENCQTWNPSEQWITDCSKEKRFICISVQ